MTPAVNKLHQLKIQFTLHEYEHDENNQAYGDEAVAKLGLDASRVFKTLVVTAEGANLAVGVVPVTSLLNLKALAKVLGCKKVAMADKQAVVRSTGYVLGGVSPMGQKKPLTTIIDSSARQFNTIFVSGGRRGLEIELTPTDLQSATNAKFAAIAQLKS